MSDDFAGIKHDAKKKKSKKAASTSSSEDSGPDDMDPPKKAKIDTVADKSKQKGNQKKGADEDASFPLSKNKFVKVRTYHGQVLVDIREFYLDAKGELKPGKKGISISAVQWEQLKGVVADVDAAILERI